MSNRLAFLESGAYCTSAHYLLLPDNHYVWYIFQYSLTLTVFDIVANRFAVLTKNINVSKNFQLAPLVDDDSTPQLKKYALVLKILKYVSK